MAITKVNNDLQDALAASQPTITSVGTLTNFTSTGIDEIYDMEVARMTADPAITSIPADKDAVVLAADIQSAAERNAAAESDLPE